MHTVQRSAAANRSPDGWLSNRNRATWLQDSERRDLQLESLREALGEVKHRSDAICGTVEAEGPGRIRSLVFRGSHQTGSDAKA
jgi:hypothetical protein